MLFACKPDDVIDISKTLEIPIEFSAIINDQENKSSPLTANIISYWDKEHKLEITIKGKANNDIKYTSPEFSKSHKVPVIGLYPSYNNTIYIKAFDNNNQLAHSEILYYQTDSVDIKLPKIEILHFNKAKLESRFTYIEYAHGISDTPFIFDENGEIRWYMKFPPGASIKPIVVKNTPDFFCGDIGDDVLYKYDWLGNEEKIPLPDNYKILHHNIYRHNKNIFFPADKDYILECTEKGSKVKEWDLKEIVKRYLPQNENLIDDGEDWIHVNSVLFNEEDNSLIVSARQTLGVFKLDYNTGNIKWILNDTTSLWYAYPDLKSLALKPIDGCELPIGQHSPYIMPNKNILLLDNGFNGYSRDSSGVMLPSKSYSRLVEYKIDENNMTVEQIFQYGKEHTTELRTVFGGSAGYDKSLDTYWSLFGDILTEGKNTEGRIIETDRDGNRLFDARLSDDGNEHFYYSSEKIFLSNYNLILNGDD